jgi:hypothetical protein
MSEPGDPEREELAAVKENAWREIAELDAALAAGRIDEQGWQDGASELVRDAYLKSDTPWGLSGHRGPEDRWTKAREIVVDPLERDGTFLDGGCANGYLMESVQRWAGRRGLRIEPYGVDIVPELAELARQRLPRWADRIWTADLLSWEPPRRFDTVRVGLEYVPPTRREQLVGRMLADVVAPGGQLLIGPYTEETDSYETVEAAREWGHTVSRMLEVAHPDLRVVRRLLVLTVPPAAATITNLQERRRRRSD